MAAVLGGQLLHADVTAPVQGTLVDPSTATVPNATLILSHPDTRMRRRAQVDAPGFRTVENKNVGLVVDQQATPNFRLRSSLRALPVQLLFLAVGERPRSPRFGAEQRLFSEFTCARRVQ